jgi:hypothetical protein
VNSDEHVDEAPATLYAKLLDEGRDLGLVSTRYRVLREHDEVRERRRKATHPSTKSPSWWLPAEPGPTWDIKYRHRHLMSATHNTATRSALELRSTRSGNGTVIASKQHWLLILEVERDATPGTDVLG